MKELKHRTKNNLQIISSLLNIQSNQIADKDVQKILQTAKNRILTMSHLEQFFDTDKDSLFMDDFIKVLCDTVLSVLGDENDLKFSVVYQLDHFEVKTPNTSLLGLIINELLTNIVKHAFDAHKDQNKVHISCTLEQGNMVLSIADNGKGYQPEQIKQDALGINLVHGLLRQTNAIIEIKSTPLGTINKMVLPVEKYEPYEGVNS